MARAIAQDAAQAANPDTALQAQVKMFLAEIAHYRGMVRAKIAEARTSNPYSRGGIKTFLGILRDRQAQLRALQVTA